MWFDMIRHWLQNTLIFPSATFRQWKFLIHFDNMIKEKFYAPSLHKKTIILNWLTSAELLFMFSLNIHRKALSKEELLFNTVDIATSPWVKWVGRKYTILASAEADLAKLHLAAGRKHTGNRNHNELLYTFWGEFYSSGQKLCNFNWWIFCGAPMKERAKFAYGLLLQSAIILPSTKFTCLLQEFYNKITNSSCMTFAHDCTGKRWVQGFKSTWVPMLSKTKFLLFFHFYSKFHGQEICDSLVLCTVE